MSTEIQQAVAHYQKYHRKIRLTGFLPNPSKTQIAAHAAQAAQELADTRREMADVLDHVPAQLHDAVIRRVTEMRKNARIDTQMSAITSTLAVIRKSRVPHGIEGCGKATAEERRIIEAGMMIRVRSDLCNDPDCRFTRLPRRRHDHVHHRLTEHSVRQEPMGDSHHVLLPDSRRPAP